MSRVYEINVAKSKFRDAYNAGNLDGLLAVFADEFGDMSAGAPSFFGADAKSVFRSRMTKLFEECRATLTVTVIAIRVFANTAFDYGWHSLTLTPRDGGMPITTRQRYFETWQKNSKGEWKIDFYIDNVDVDPMMPGADLPIPLAFRPPDTQRQRHQKLARAM
ncbi:MAG: nuclear transport factor 2 family protein [Candidatus Sulfotelmatobacter sp.]